jgi:hypothetical protein
MARPFRDHLHGTHHSASGEMLTEQECRRLPPTLVPVRQRRVGNRAADLGADREALGVARWLAPKYVASDGFVLLGRGCGCQMRSRAN